MERERGSTKLVEDALAAGGVAVGVAGKTSVNGVVVDAGVDEGFNAGFKAELGVVDFVAGLDELCHSDAEDVDGGWGGHCRWVEGEIWMLGINFRYVVVVWGGGALYMAFPTGQYWIANDILPLACSRDA